MMDDDDDEGNDVDRRVDVKPFSMPRVFAQTDPGGTAARGGGY